MIVTILFCYCHQFVWNCMSFKWLLWSTLNLLHEFLQCLPSHYLWFCCDFMKNKIFQFVRGLRPTFKDLNLQVSTRGSNYKEIDLVSKSISFNHKNTMFVIPCHLRDYFARPCISCWYVDNIDKCIIFISITGKSLFLLYRWPVCCKATKFGLYIYCTQNKV